jgi:hypothetical protein
MFGRDREYQEMFKVRTLYLYNSNSYDSSLFGRDAVQLHRRSRLSLKSLSLKTKPRILFSFFRLLKVSSK